MTHSKTAGPAPALGIVRPVVTLEPCTRCKVNAVCQPVPGRHGRKAYPYCVETCWPLAMAARETVVKDAPAAERIKMRCSCCGEFGHVRAVATRLGMTGLFFCEASCWSDRLAGMSMVPTCQRCDKYLKPDEYQREICGVCE